MAIIIASIEANDLITNLNFRYVDGNYIIPLNNCINRDSVDRVILS
jgi:hypothetical protein